MSDAWRPPSKLPASQRFLHNFDSEMVPLCQAKAFSVITVKAEAGAAGVLELESESEESEAASAHNSSDSNTRPMRARIAGHGWQRQGEGRKKV